jgi:hypothetical protein
MTNTRPLKETFGAYWDVVTLLAYGEERNNVLLVSDRTLYILNNLSLVDIHNLGRYYLEKFPSGYASFVDEFDTEAEDIMDVANNVGLELFPVADIRPVYGFTAVRTGTDQTIATATETAVSWSTIDSLDAEFVTYASNVFTIKRSGRLVVTANLWWGASTVGNRRIIVKLDGTEVLQHRTHPVLSTGLHQSATFHFSVLADQTLQLFCFQNSGGNLDLVCSSAPLFNTSFSVMGF